MIKTKQIKTKKLMARESCVLHEDFQCHITNDTEVMGLILKTFEETQSQCETFVYQESYYFSPCVFRIVN